MTAELGGTVATNASGARSFRFGPTRDHIETLQVILITGELITLKRGQKYKIYGIPIQNGNIQIELPSYSWPKVKNASGLYSSPQADPVDLFIGSEGTLGAICSIGIRLMEKPQFISGLSFFPSRYNAFDFADFLRREKQVAAIEYFDQSILNLLKDDEISIGDNFPVIPSHLNNAVYWEYIENENDPFENQLEVWEEALNRYGSSLDETLSGFDPSESEKLKNFRHAVPELINSIVARISACVRRCVKSAPIHLCPVHISENGFNPV